MNPKLLILMYHRISDTTRQGTLEHFRSHLESIVQKWPVVLPGERLTSPMNVCITFDDAYYDFYHYVYPLLRSMNIKAVLGVPTDFIQERTQVAPQTRLSVPYPLALEPPFHQEKSPLCTWEELAEMADSSHVALASHSASHCHLSRDRCDLDQELAKSKSIIEQKCFTRVNTFIYPFGNLSRSLAKQVSKHYSYSMRIGGAMNSGWSPLLYRVDAEQFWPTNQPIKKQQLAQLYWRYWFNRVRGK